MARIAIGGFQHETNTFAPSPADYAAFEAGGGWPGVQYGEPLFAAVAGANIPAAGAIDALHAAGHQLVGTAWAAASPSAAAFQAPPRAAHQEKRTGLGSQARPPPQGSNLVAAGTLSSPNDAAPCGSPSR